MKIIILRPKPKLIKVPYGPIAPAAPIPIFTGNTVIVLPVKPGKRIIKLYVYGYGKVVVGGKEIYVSSEHTRTIKVVLKTWGIVLVRVYPEKFIGIESFEIY